MNVLDVTENPPTEEKDVVLNYGNESSRNNLVNNNLFVEFVD